jgi:hypothetical protein
MFTFLRLTASVLSILAALELIRSRCQWHIVGIQFHVFAWCFEISTETISIAWILVLFLIKYLFGCSDVHFHVAQTFPGEMTTGNSDKKNYGAIEFISISKFNNACSSVRLSCSLEVSSSNVDRSTSCAGWGFCVVFHCLFSNMLG